MSLTSYSHLDIGSRIADFTSTRVQQGRITGGPERNRIVIGEDVNGVTIASVEITRAQTFINERRVLVVSYNTREPAGTLGYTVVVRPGCSVGDHYHHRREERILVLHGRAQFRLLDQRPDSPSYGEVNVFTLEDPGFCVRVPTGVAHAVIAEGTLTVLQVLASSDYDPADDVHVEISSLSISSLAAARA